ncbi:MAG: hypothetical protein JSU86_17695 [Phycisphaerales bacterium]|nr:MAG: hypothetical protein JSU86_17695 [Phycisphaerales bacterium]
MNVTITWVRRVTVLAALTFAFAGTSPAAAETFDDNCGLDPVPCDDQTSSRGCYRIVVECRWRPLLTGCPPYNPYNHANGGWDYVSKLYSSTLYDWETKIGRSASHADGDNADQNGTPVGSAGTVIADGDLVHPAGFEGPPDTREVHTEINRLEMTGHWGETVRAGRPSFDHLLMTPGEVESELDDGYEEFPAESFFNVFVEVDIPSCGLFGAGEDSVTVYNDEALLVQADGLERFPPRVIYVHGETDAVPVKFRTKYPSGCTSGVNCVWEAGDVFGWVDLAGHGVEYGEDEEVEYERDFHVPPKPEMPVLLTGMGACVLEGEPGQPCIPVMTAECCEDPALEGTYQGDGSTCLTGACVLSNEPGEPCFDGMTRATCEEPLLGGTYQGDGTICPRGACCGLQDCIEDTMAVCNQWMLGKYRGDGTTCAVECPQPIRAVRCDGMESGGTGEVDESCGPGLRMYAYPVSDPNGSMTDLYIGTDDCNPANYSAVCMPLGWTFTVGKSMMPHDPDKTPHDRVSSGPRGNCHCTIHWSDNGIGGGLPGGSFTFGFNSKQPSHDVEWELLDGTGGTSANWESAVGGGVGPVHGPTGAIPAVTGWGMIVMALLVIVAATIVIKRLRETRGLAY